MLPWCVFKLKSTRLTLDNVNFMKWKFFYSLNFNQLCKKYGERFLTYLEVDKSIYFAYIQFT